MLQVLQCRHQRLQVVAVNRADVVQPQFLEQRSRRQHPLDVLFGTLGELAQGRREVEDLFAGLAGSVEGAPGKKARQIAVQRAHGRRDRHVIVVEDDQHVGVGDAGVVQRLKGLAGRHRAIADDCHDFARLALDLGGQRHPQSGRNRGRGMADAEGVIAALAALRKPGNATVHAQFGHAGTTAGEHLVGVGLVTDVPDQAVVWRFEDMMQGDGEFDRTEVRREVPTGAGDRVDEEGTQFVGQLRQLSAVERAHLCRIADGIEQRITGHGFLWIQQNCSVVVWRGERRSEFRTCAG